MRKDRLPKQPKIDRALENIRRILLETDFDYPLSDDDLLYYDDADGKWKNKTAGTGGGLDADTVDGEHATAFADAVHNHDHNSLINYLIAEHRTIDDDSTKATDLWSAQKINTELGSIAETIWTCPSTATVNQVVYADSADTLAVASYKDDPFSPPVGIIQTKITDTTCEIQRYGLKGAFTGITVGESYFLDADGGIRDTIPPDNYVYRVGVGVNSSTILLTLDSLYIKRT